MTAQTQTRPGRKPGILLAELRFRPAELDINQNNPEADETTPRALEQGYGGRFVVFGHGGCYGDLGHCDVPTESRGPHDLRPPHPLAPQTRIITVTEALERVLREGEGELTSVTLVPISKDPIRENRGLTESLFRFDRVELLTYE
jgi:tyrosinase